MDRPLWIQITPFFGVSRLDQSVAFFKDVLGFSIWSPGGGYAYAEHDRIGLRLLELDGSALNPPGCSHAYVDVSDVERLFAELEPRLRGLPSEQWGAPKDQPYGQREFWVRDPDGNMLTFGQGIGDNAAQWDDRFDG
jgi:catechol 2,3-dioxygenase-like lactoylglutathione lyase family enzyme